MPFPSFPDGSAFSDIDLDRLAGGERRRRVDLLLVGAVLRGRIRIVTKPRETNSIEEVLTDVMGTAGLGRARCVEVTGRSVSYLLEASDPDKPQLLSAQDMIKLDLAHIEYDGNSPFHDAIGVMLAVARASIYVDAAAIARATREVLKEDGEAHLALFAACQPGATDKELRDALRETTEAAVATTQAIETVRSVLEKRNQMPP